MARAVAVLSTVLCGAELVPQLRGSLGELESCVSKPNFHRAQSSWCGQQQEPVACFKELDELNPIWDCHLQSAQCSLGAKPCAWPKVELQVPERKVSESAAGQPTRFVTWNLYVFTLAGRIHPVVDELMRMQPEIAAIPEMWHEKHAILDRLNQVSGNVYAFATGGQTEQFNDADILFRADKWEHVASDLVPFSAGRAVNWAALRRKSDGYTLLPVGDFNGCVLQYLQYHLQKILFVPTPNRLAGSRVTQLFRGFPQFPQAGGRHASPLLPRGLRRDGGCGFCNSHLGWNPTAAPVSYCPLAMRTAASSFVIVILVDAYYVTCLT